MRSVLVVNVGSSSVKLRLVVGEEVAGADDLAAEAGRFDAGALASAAAALGSTADVVGHRVVHGGRRFTEAVVLDEATERALRELDDLAPLHQQPSLDGIAAVRRTLPDLPAVACFDTAFHATLPPAAATYAVPRQWRDQWGVRRYGFHGLSHSYGARRAAELCGSTPGELRIVTCHLGAGASLAAVEGGVSVDTTMGFTPLEGLVMATRSGTVDPGLVTWLTTHAGLRAEEVADALEHRSGLLALAGTSDMAEVVARAAGDDPAASAALELYVHRLRAGVASMAAAMGGLDVLAFTGGVGEHAPAVRAGAANGLGFLGVELDQHANLVAAGDAVVSAPRARVRTVVVTSREDLQIAREVRALLGASPPAAS